MKQALAEGQVRMIGTRVKIAGTIGIIETRAGIIETRVGMIETRAGIVETRVEIVGDDRDDRDSRRDSRSPRRGERDSRDTLVESNSRRNYYNRNNDTRCDDGRDRYARSASPDYKNSNSHNNRNSQQSQGYRNNKSYRENVRSDSRQKCRTSPEGPGGVLSARAHERMRAAARRAVLYSAARTARDGGSSGGSGEPLLESRPRSGADPSEAEKRRRSAELGVTYSACLIIRDFGVYQAIAQKSDIATSSALYSRSQESQGVLQTASANMQPLHDDYDSSQNKAIHEATVDAKTQEHARRSFPEFA
ncbi:unnamed protein product [Trichogramma brassicae]|uniref:Uncharacterized protein n=1 Tax=Trichogramma brassicae TaxID=86971 RepID=A0A6H5IXE5_9HYME|nr:unnamed protein product [Trichogramma brassicae]